MLAPSFAWNKRAVLTAVVSEQHGKEPVRKGLPGVIFPGSHLACGQSSVVV